MKAKKPSFVVVALQAATIIRFILIILVTMVFIFLVTGLLTSLKPEFRPSSDSVNEATGQVPGKILYKYLGQGNKYFLQSFPEEETESVSRQIFQSLTNISLNDPRSLLGHELPGYSLFDGEILVAGEGTNYTNMPIESPPSEEAMEKDTETEEIVDEEEPVKPEQAGTQKTKEEVMYIYFSHTRESYLPLLKGVTNPNSAFHSKANVTLVGEKLKKSLEAKGIGTKVDKTDVNAILNKKGLQYGSSYSQSRSLVQEVMANDKNLKYFIDVHRDSQRKKVTTISINGKAYARLCFIIGGENPNYEQNLKLAEEMHKKISEKYPGLSRGVFEKRGAGTNGKFNQDLSGNAMLVEAGGVDNTLDELSASMEVLADVLAEHYWDAEPVQGNAAE
ncbi:stage II sporulation protein P [Bacillus sp. D386]|uniref:stage II sporulation protein P n=1 Tax=Bacillus sp. D386 TaxID=2587155 RepID=UPI00111DD071|nr:stage II sporulation protein P [Bacillus sp. D386]